MSLHQIYPASTLGACRNTELTINNSDIKCTTFTYFLTTMENTFKTIFDVKQILFWEDIRFLSSNGK